MKLSRSNFLHLLRWVAASLVAFSHIRSVIFKNFDAVTGSGLFTKGFYFITNLGHQSVIIFFVLSGYLVAGSVIKQVKAKTFNLTTYSINRFSRLYAVLLVALLMTLAFDHLGIYFDHIGLYTHKVSFATIDYSIADRLSAGHFFASLFMLQNILLPTLGSNSPLWSLSYEFWYYLLFPCILLAITYLKSNIKKALIPVILLISMSTLLPLGILQYFLIWLFGLIPFYLTLNKAFYKYILLAVLVIWLILKKSGGIDSFLYDIVLGVIVAFLVAAFKNDDQPLSNSFLRFNEKLSSFSYSIYLIHFPTFLLLITLLNNYAIPCTVLPPSILAYGIFVFVFSVTLIVSYIVACYTEFKTPQFRAYLKQIIEKKTIELP
ncbi:acyltransferase [Mucilaginibacter sp. HMF5004]|uniref:acyltransferase family protein n=1 Tax=Mucilaginibacter rivuli TaxID=2857527 RepID=UPI001C5EE81D|nr:acyltransferase [Mucilaginibacter rivuli]MBW4890088.1 acyltransferase [Mucilaginibacter rivuli]